MSARYRAIGCIGMLLATTACRGDLPPSQRADAPEPDELGFVDFGVHCDPAVRETFDRAIALFHHMTYPVAAATFEEVATRDPDCSMAYWGMAMTQFQPLWPNRPGEDELRRGWELVQQARAHGPQTEREEMFVATAEAFFDPAQDTDYWARIERWAAATTRLHERLPDDEEASALFALAQLAVAPRVDRPADNHARAAAVLRGVLDRHPTHPGAVHYTIHANDFAGREHESLDVVRSYARIAPRNPHALHMPTHIFTRLGDWPEVVAWNLRAAEAALAQRVGPDDAWIWDEYPHAVEYLVYAYLQQADDAAAERAIAELADMPDLQPTFKTAFHLASTAARYALERHDWAGAAALEVRSPAWVEWDAFRWPEATAWFARGLGATRLGRTETSRRSLDRLQELQDASAAAGEGPFAVQIEILRLELEAWVVLSAGSPERAISLMTEAVDLEERTPKHPVTPGPTIPALELLGDMYMELSDYERAAEAYRDSELRTPHRLNAVLGLARALAAQGEEGAAGIEYRRAASMTVEGASRAEVVEARARATR